MPQGARRPDFAATLTKVFTTPSLPTVALTGIMTEHSRHRVWRPAFLPPSWRRYDTKCADQLPNCHSGGDASSAASAGELSYHRCTGRALKIGLDNQLLNRHCGGELPAPPFQTATRLRKHANFELTLN